MFKSLLGIAPKAESDGSFSPSWLALKLATSTTTDYQPVSYEAYTGPRSKILVVFTEQKNMTMTNGRAFSTGNHPVEAFVPLLHLRAAGFDIEVATPSGKPVVLEMWAMPTEDDAVMGLYKDLKDQLDAPASLEDLLGRLDPQSTAAVFVPGGHGAMLGIPDDPKVGRLLRWAHAEGLHTITLCHGPGALLATALAGEDFLYSDYRMAVFPDSVDKQTPMIGYLPGPMPWELGAKLQELGVTIVNTKGDDTCVVDRRLITGASPQASDKLGKLSATTLLEHLRAES